MLRKMGSGFAALVLAAVALGGLVVAPSAMAATYLDAAVGTMFTDVGADVTTVMGYGWILFGIIVGGLIAFTIVKKVLQKSVGK